MKKFVKMSLVAAVAVAGLTSTVSAKDLSEAIKGVDVSGQFRYRAEDKSTDTGVANRVNTDYTDVEIEVGVKVPVTDMVTAVFKIDNANDDNGVSDKGALTIEDYYFSYSNAGLTVNAGQQNIPGRMTDGAQGDGIVATKNVSGITLGAAAFITNTLYNGATNVNRGADVLSVFASGKIGPVSISAQYADVTNLADAYTVKADATIEMLTIGGEFSSTDLDASSASEYETTKVYASASVDALKATVTYASTGTTGSGSLHAATGATYADSVEAPAEFLLWQLGSAVKADLDVIAIDATYSINDKISLRVAYADGDYKNGGTVTDVTETLGQVNYKVASNLDTYFRFSQYDADTAASKSEITRGRVEIKYSF